MTPAPRFLGLDTIMIDVVLKISELPLRGLDEVATSRLVSAGGGFNALSAAARQGMTATYLGQIGSGPFADIALRALEEEGIDTPIRPRTDVDLGLCLVLVESDGERTFVTSPGAEGRLTATELSTVEVSSGDVLFMSGYDVVYPEIAAQVMTWFRTLANGVVVAFDPGPRVMDIPADVLEEVLARADWLSCNAHEARSLAGDVALEQVAVRLLERTGRSGVVIRDGADGCYLARPREATVHVRALPTRVVDTNGAGDVHNGVFLAEASRGTDLLEALQRANVAASIAIGQLGPATCPRRDVVSATWANAY
ncbi:MAG: PfkB family carbohydrate kinase [Acidimicrobiales bacterium]